MITPVEVRTLDDRQRFCALAGGSPLSPEMLDRQQPDASWLLVNDNQPVARCSLWWTDVPGHEAYRIGTVGHFVAASLEETQQLLNFACRQLEQHNCTLAIGPMDGNTWRSYRLVTEPGTEPPFFLEPENPDTWPQWFVASGFEPLAHYFSALATDLAAQDARLAQTAAKIAVQGIGIRTLDIDRFETELRSIYELSLASFRSNILYTPISIEEFLALYLPIRAHVRPELVLLAEKDGVPVGYVFALPDLLEAQREGKVHTVILKTLAVHPDYGGLGLGGLLTARCHDAARQLGYRRVIHALMHETNKSRRISSHTAVTLRRYTLYAKPLGDARTPSPLSALATEVLA